MKSSEWHTSAKTRWEDNADHWHSKSVEMWTTGSRKAVIPFFHEYAGKARTVADLGCGDGYGSYLLYEKGYWVTGMDFSRNMIELAKEQERDNLSFVQGDLNSLPFDGGQFDAVMAINSVEWTENPLHTLNEIERIVRKDGFICIGLLGPTAHPRENAYPRLQGKEVICNTMMPWELEKLAQDKGWKKVGEDYIYKKGVKPTHTDNLSNELKQALTFTTLFMFQK
ncbi:class I SAM-dependent methyltransferase [Rossellomorea vietnamensis]|uniref:class I SAM-dependent methyltransferase n=1 Tax=Rossellomorea vietnamensis TaxID=218284 RepID=UPI00308B3D8A|nr:class I SAM-dependent methyltransferase [Rossellomorea vietnamensis]WQI96072.1 class I SAM-dependent methyltransferase [Rossellomorea vietnamensis]